MSRIEQLPERVNANAALVRRGRHLSVDCMIEVGTAQYLLRIEQGRIAAMTPVRLNLQPWTFAIRASEEAWERFWEPVPPPGYHDLIALLRYGRVRFEGDLRPLMGNLLYLKAMLETLRSPEGDR